MVKGLVIPAVGPVRFREIKSYVDLRQEVGGYIEAIPAAAGLVMYGNEDGKNHRLPMNVRASSLAYAGGGILGDDAVVGTVVVVGPTDPEGDDTEIPEESAEFLRSVDLWPNDV